ncbi:MAG: thiolase domain-containing protein [Candidatus Bathyarchaeota archaeon]|jgi:acetyl-CoA C-acetyltransferase|nr:thiolase domain-containing protein [Candidatus Bathyarchaeota archaeon A05DMB-3]MDH7606698.1 thiolase domain-containing protein [Candidatus Bathyarchaeota archaeon]
MCEVAIVGVGCVGFRPITLELSYKELMFEAAVKAYEDAGGIDPRKDVDVFVTCAEDYLEGFSIFDEFVPDQLGAALRHLFTVSGDGMLGLATAYMLIKTGHFDTVVVEAHSKASDILTYMDIVNFGLDPIFNRPLGGHPYYIAGLEMNRYLHDTCTTEEQCAQVVVKNKKNAIANPYAAYGADVTLDQVLCSKTLFHPLKKLEISTPADGCIVMVLASEKVAEKLTDKPVWVKGVGWCTETPSLETRDWTRAIYTRLAAEMAYKTAGIANPWRDIDFAEIHDMFAYKELQHMEALKLCDYGEAGKLTEEGLTALEGEFPVNASGGLLGMGFGLEASGLQKVLEVVLQLRGEAGSRQIEDVEAGLAHTWRGIPTATGAVAVLSNVK